MTTLSLPESPPATTWIVPGSVNDWLVTLSHQRFHILDIAKDPRRTLR